jgi:CspA family cold shock protein
MEKGTVKVYFASKGFGFITPADGSEEVFVHVSKILDTISEGDEVSYDKVKSRKGFIAENVKLV